MAADDEAAARALLSAAAVRERTDILFAAAEAGRLFHFELRSERLPAVADYVVATIRANYPSLDVPFHARWRHFCFDGYDRWESLLRFWSLEDKAARARAEFDLAIVSVLLDAGAGNKWTYADDGLSGKRIARSEGLAIASINMFAGGLFSLREEDPLRADGPRLASIRARDLEYGFGAGKANPLAGLRGRAALLATLGRVVTERREIFGRQDFPRPGGLYDFLAAEAAEAHNRLPAADILTALLVHLGPIWPSGLTFGGVALGDTWRHPLVATNDATSGLVPFHKLSQWLAYSLIEPLQRAGIEVTDIDGLTGLPEYRNGGLFLDLGAIALKDAAAARRAHEPGSTLVVEWRALTVALLDRLAPLARERLGLSAEQFPLAKLLEGGTWAAGRRIAREKRGDGAPPLSIISDGTVF